MQKVLLHTPEGVRDIYGKECDTKLLLENLIVDKFNSYGYHNIQTPTFEFFDVFSAERGSVASKNLYKFFDREGNTLVLRPDLTPSIARAASKYYMDVDYPIRMCYNANTYINNSELQGKLKETTQLGCELINDGSIEADAEIIALVVDSLKQAGLDKFLVEIGEVDFYRGLLSECGFDDETELELGRLIAQKNNFGLNELLASKNISEKIKEAFYKLPQLFGSADVLDEAKKFANNDQSENALLRLHDLFNRLEEYGVSDYISFDLGMLGNFNYYTGIIFKAYTYGTGNEIVTGGRYDSLLKQFGKNAPAVGFAVHVDQLLIPLLSLDSKAKSYESRVIIYEKNAFKKALEIADNHRKSGIHVELVPLCGHDIMKFAKFKTEEGADTVLFVSEDEAKDVSVKESLSGKS